MNEKTVTLKNGKTIVLKACLTKRERFDTLSEKQRLYDRTPDGTFTPKIADQVEMTCKLTQIDVGKCVISFDNSPDKVFERLLDEPEEIFDEVMELINGLAPKAKTSDTNGATTSGATTQ